MSRPRCNGPRCFLTHMESTKNAHETVLQALNRWMVFKNQGTGEDEKFYYGTNNFVPTQSTWDVTPLIFAQEHPDPALVKKDLATALKSVKTIDGNDGYICGTMTDSNVVVAGQPRLVTNIVFDDPKLEAMYNEGKLALSSAFYCPNDENGHLNGPVEPNHVLVFVQDENNQPRDLGSGWWHNKARTHGGPGSGRYPKGSGAGKASDGGFETGNPNKYSGQGFHGGTPPTEHSPVIKEAIGKVDQLAIDAAGEDFAMMASGRLDEILQPFDETWEAEGIEELTDNYGQELRISLRQDYPKELDPLNKEDKSRLAMGIAKQVQVAFAERAHELGKSNYTTFGARARDGFVNGFMPDLTFRFAKEDKDVSRIQTFANMIHEFVNRLANGGGDDPSSRDGDRPPVNFRPPEPSLDGDGEDDMALEEKLKELDGRIASLQKERDTLTASVAEMAKTNKALADANEQMKKTLGDIETEKENKAWANLRDTQIPRGWLVGDNAEETQRAEYNKDRVAYLNKILEHRKTNPKEETGVAFTNQSDSPNTDDAKLNALLSVQKNIPGRLH